MKSGLIIFNTLAVTLRTDNAAHWTQDAGRMTLSPTTLYYKLTGELKIMMWYNIVDLLFLLVIHTVMKYETLKSTVDFFMLTFT